MSRYVVGITLDKVQNFLYQTFKSNTANKQAEGKTLQEVIQASNRISTNLLEEVRSVFEAHISEELVTISGKIIFYTNLNEEEIKQRLKCLFKKHYLSSGGYLKLNYTYFIVEESEKDNKFKEILKNIDVKDFKMKAIRIAEEKLRLARSMTQVIEDNQKVLFDFPSLEEVSHKQNNKDFVQSNTAAQDGIFINDIDEMKPKLDERIGKTQQEDADFFRIAVIKADLDGMGDLFKSIKQFTQYDKASKLLNDSMSINALRVFLEKQPERKKEAENKKRKKEDKIEVIKYFCFDEKLLPFYVAGDDIFFATRVSDIFGAVEVLKLWLDEINQKLKANGFKKELTLSVGIEVVAHSLPLRYMYEEVEGQLKLAKEKKNDDAKLNILIYNQAFYLFNGAAGSGSQDGWNKFKEEISFIENARDKAREQNQINHQLEDITSSRFFYQLLKKVNESDVSNNHQDYMNQVLYHLFPSTDSKVNRVKAMLLNQFLEPFEKEGQKRKLQFEVAEQRIRFENRLRLFLLFSDVRYQVKFKSDDLVIEGLKSKLVLKPQEYLYDFLKQKDVAKLFIDDTGNDTINVDGEEYKANFYKTVPIGTSMFHRLKRLLGKKDFSQEEVIKKSAQAIATVSKSAEDYANANREEIKKKRIEEGKNYRDYKKDFKVEEFSKLALETENWNAIMIKSLMLFYQYIDVLPYWKKKRKRKMRKIKIQVEKINQLELNEL